MSWPMQQAPGRLLELVEGPMLKGPMPSEGTMLKGPMLEGPMLSDEGPMLSDEGPMLSDEGPMLETLDYTICICSTPSFLYFDLIFISTFIKAFVQEAKPFFPFLKTCIDLFCQGLRSGTTGVVAFLRGNTLHIAWAGDSQITLCKRGMGVNLMQPHKPNRKVSTALYEL